MKRRDPLDDLLGSGRPPSAPAALRARTLARAEAAWRERTASGAPLSVRLWESRGLRFAWGAAVLVLLAGHLAWSSRLPVAGPRAASTAPAGPDSGRDRDYRELFDLPRIELQSIVWLGEPRLSAPPESRTQDANPEEKTS